MGRDRLLRQLLRERFVITLLTGECFDGLLERWDETTVEFVNCFAVTKNARVQVDGRLYFPRKQVSYLQRPEAS